MKLVIDANELFSSIIAKGKGRLTKKLRILFSDKVKIFAPRELLKELDRNKEEIRQKSGFSEIDFNVFVGLLELNIEFIPSKDFSDKLPEAKEISPNDKDVPYFALALKLDSAIWSGDKAFKQQSRVKVFNTKDLIKEFGL